MDILLNGVWNYILDESDKGKEQKWFEIPWIKANLSTLEKISVPSNFNTLPGLDRYAGVFWYFILLPEVPRRPQSHEYSIEFEGSNYITEIWLNGQFLGLHEGGFLPFRFEFPPSYLSYITPNYLAIRVDNLLYRDGVPSNLYDWYNWGGIHRTVKLLLLEKTRIYRIKISTEKITLSPHEALIHIDCEIKRPQEYLDRCYAIQIKPQIEYEVFYLGQFSQGKPQINKILIQTGIQEINPESMPSLSRVSHDKKSIQDYFAEIPMQTNLYEEPVDLETYFTGTQTPTVSNLEQDTSDLTTKYLHNTVHITIYNPACWTPEFPELYQLKLRLNGVDEDKEIRFGIREISVHHTHLYLNHKPIRLRGINLHEELLPYGRTIPGDLRRRDLQHIKSLGFNALRTAHYPHDAMTLNIADEEGILIFEEIPVYWNCAFKERKTLRLALRMLHDLINRDFNHPSIILWSVGNEVPTLNFACYRFFRLLLRYAEKLDPTRLISYVSNNFLTDTLRRHTPVNCLNIYFGWYYATIFQLNWFLDMLYYTHPDSPWIITEFGAGAKQGFHHLSKKFSEEVQTQILAHSIKVFNSKPQIAGWFIWIYRDFRSPLRQNKYQLGFNRKGIVDDANHPKGISHILPHMINTTLPTIRHHRQLAFLLGLFYLWMELLYNFIIVLGENSQRRTTRKYYHLKKQAKNLLPTKAIT